jgi:CPA2 family monovalent cation:H+ antiporter-2
MALAQIGEFSFVLAAVGRQSGLITDWAHQLAIAVIALSLLVSPFRTQLGRMLRSRGRPGRIAGR